MQTTTTSEILPDVHSRLIVSFSQRVLASHDIEVNNTSDMAARAAGIEKIFTVATKE